MRGRPFVAVECPTAPRSARQVARRIERIVRRLAPAVGLDPGGVRVRVLGAEAMLDLGRRHLGKTEPTDVLSFPDDARGGDVALCWPVIVAQAPGAPLEELARLCVHGLCHLAGYDHATASQGRAMLRKERALLRRIGVPDVPRPYGRLLRPPP